MQILSTKLAVIYFSKEELFYLRYKFSQNSTQIHYAQIQGQKIMQILFLCTKLEVIYFSKEKLSISPETFARQIREAIS